ncbi:MAG TPA: hypothetical protein VJZ26_15120 [Blastocatellia bacterium]|nr:hypothetical protein [Blastocatellia bacterium]
MRSAEGETIDELLHAASAVARQRKAAGKLAEFSHDLTETRLVS